MHGSERSGTSVAGPTPVCEHCSHAAHEGRCASTLKTSAMTTRCACGAGRFEIVNLWNGGALGRKIEFTSEAAGVEGSNECFRWILDHTPFSNFEAPRQGYVTREVEPSESGDLVALLNRDERERGQRRAAMNRGKYAGSEQ